MLLLSNDLLKKMTPDEIVKTVVDEFREKLGMTVAAGLHLKHKNDGKDNLHVHVVFPDRELLQEPVVKIAERNLFFDAQGKRRYKKSEILDENKQLLPGCRIVKKGEVYEQRYFGSVDPKYSSKSWLKHVKTDVILSLRNGKLKGDIEITEYDPSTGKLAQQHIGNKIRDPKVREQIRQYNMQVIQYNRLIDSGRINPAALRSAQFPGVARNQERRHTIRVRHDWKVQKMVDAIRLAREMGTTNAAEFEGKRGELGRILGQAKRNYAAAVQMHGEDSLQAKIAEAELIKAKKDYAALAQTIEDNRLKEWTPEKHTPAEPGSR